MNGYTEILLGRNRTKRRFSDYRYEAMQSLMRKATGSSSEFSFAVCAMALKAMGKEMPYLTGGDRLIIQKIRVCITSKR